MANQTSDSGRPEARLRADGETPKRTGSTPRIDSAPIKDLTQGGQLAGADNMAMMSMS